MWYASSLSTYFTPKSYTTGEREIGSVICCHNIGVCVTSKYLCGGRFHFGPLFASVTACGSPYIDFMISTYMYPFFAFYLKLYCCIICYRNVDKYIHIYLYWSNRVQRFKLLMSTNMCLALMVIMMMFHNIFYFIRSDILIMISTVYFMRLPPAVILTRLGSVFCVW